MNTLRGGMILGWLLLVSIGRLAVAEATNAPAATLPAWETITNRWGAMALETIQQQAEAGDVSAQYYLADWHFTSDGPGNDPGQAFAWMQRAAQFGGGQSRKKTWLDVFEWPGDRDQCGGAV